MVQVFVDGHCHCHEMELSELRRYREGYLLVAVSDDVASSYKTLELASIMDNVVPCIGIHPWSIGEHSVGGVEAIERLVSAHNVRCLGEIGLDKVFVRKSYEKQVEVFERFLGIAREHGLAVNLHTPGAWRIVYEMLLRHDIDKAYFHWYTGPLNLLRDIAGSGYYIGINPAWIMQEKHRRIIEEAPLQIMITESDAPYEYKGLRLTPSLIERSIEKIAEAHGVGKERVLEKIRENASRLYGV